MPRYTSRRPVPRAYDKRPGWIAVDLTKQRGPIYVTIPEGHTLYAWRDHIPSVSARNPPPDMAG